MRLLCYVCLLYKVLGFLLDVRANNTYIRQRRPQSLFSYSFGLNTIKKKAFFM